MFNRDRYADFAPWIVTATGLCLVAATAFTISYSKGYQAANKDRQADYKAYGVAEETYRKCAARSPVEEALRCYAEAEKASREDHRAEQDLNAQRQMADWAEWMFYATAIIGAFTVGVAGVGVYWVRETLVASARFNEMQLRAYLIVKEISAEYVYAGGSGNRRAVRVKLTVENGGATPAVDIGQKVIITEQIYKGVGTHAVVNGTRSVVAMTIQDRRIDDLAPEAITTVYEAELPLAGFSSFTNANHLNFTIEGTVQYRPVVSAEDDVLNFKYWVLGDQKKPGRINIRRQRP